MRKPANARPGRTVLSLVLGLLIGTTVGGLSVWYVLPRDNTRERSNGSIELPRLGEIPALGRIEPEGGILSIYGTPGDRIIAFKNKADQLGATVKAGDVLVEMTGDVLRKKEVELAQRQLEDAQAAAAAIDAAAAARKKEAKLEFENLKQTRQAELDAQQAKLDVARLQLKQAETQLERVRGLSPGSVARADIEQQELGLRKGQAELKAGEASLAAAKKALDDAEDLARAREAAAEAEVKRAKLAVPVETAQLALDTAQKKQEVGRITAPVDGTVVRVQTVVGETVTQVKPILQLAGPGDLVVRAEIPDAEVDRVRRILEVGGTIPVRITSRSLRALEKLRGELKGPENLALAISRNTVVGLTPGSESDRRVVEATIRIVDRDEAKLTLARSVLGLQVEATLEMPPASKP